MSVINTTNIRTASETLFPKEDNPKKELEQTLIAVLKEYESGNVTDLISKIEKIYANCKSNDIELDIAFVAQIIAAIKPSMKLTDLPSPQLEEMYDALLFVFFGQRYQDFPLHKEEILKLPDMDRIAIGLHVASRGSRLFLYQGMPAVFVAGVPETVRIRLAKELAKNNGTALLESFESFHITNPSVILELAEMLTKKLDDYLFQFTFLIKEPELREEIFKKYIGSYDDITFFHVPRHCTSTQLMEFGRILAKTDGDRLSWSIDDWPIDDEEARFELANLAFQNNPAAVIRRIDSFKIQDKRKLLLLARAAVVYCPDILVEFIDQFKFKEQEMRDELALTIAKRRGLGRSSRDLNYTFELNPEIVRQIVPYYARRNPEMLFLMGEQFVYKVDVFAISCFDPTARDHFGRHVFPYAQKQDYLELCLFETDFNPLSFLSKLPELHLSAAASVQWVEFFDKCDRDPTQRKAKGRLAALLACALDFSHSYPDLADQWNHLIRSLDKEKNGLDKEKDLLVLEQQIDWIASFLLRCRTNEFEGTLENFFPASYMPLMSEILDLRDPSLKSLLQDYFIDLLYESPMRENFDKARSQFKLKDDSGLIAVMLLAKYFPITERMVQGIRGFNSDRIRMKTILGHLYALLDEHRLSPSEKQTLVEKVIFGKQGSTVKDRTEHALVAGALISHFIVFDEVHPHLVDTLKETENLETLQKQFHEIFVLGFQLQKEKDFTKKFMAQFSTLPKLESLLVYRGKMQQLALNERDPMLKTLNGFVKGILNKTYSKERYDPTGSPHLQILDTQAHAVFTKWQSGSSAKQMGETALIITDHYWHLFLLGIGTCQSPYAGPKYNKALLGYPQNGYIRMIAVINQKTDILSRRIIRLLWDNRNKRAVLFREPVYPKKGPLNEKYKGLLDRASLDFANDLGVPLLTKDESARPYLGTVVCLGGKTPFECVDGLLETDQGHIVPGDKPYTIKDAQVIEE